MIRRSFLSTLLGAALAPIAAKAKTQPYTLLLQESPLAGFQYYEAYRIWPALAVGDALSLTREPNNRKDQRAVAVYWHDHKLGYLPRIENTAAAQLMDRGQRLSAKITGLNDQGGPWERIRLAVYLTA